MTKPLQCVFYSDGAGLFSHKELPKELYSDAEKYVRASQVETKICCLEQEILELQQSNAEYQNQLGKFGDYDYWKMNSIQRTDLLHKAGIVLKNSLLCIAAILKTYYPTVQPESFPWYAQMVAIKQDIDNELDVKE